MPPAGLLAWVVLAGLAIAVVAGFGCLDAALRALWEGRPLVEAVVPGLIGLALLAASIFRVTRFFRRS